jgi:hypothetical protein
MRTGFLTIVFITSLNNLLAKNDLFPEIRGWEVQIDKEIFTTANLYELIDGAADLYIQYGFQQLNIATYRCDDDIEVRVELYHHDLPENAYGIYASERMSDYNFIPLGIQGYTGEGILNFLTGEYYVKIMSTGRKNAGEGNLRYIAEKIIDNLKQNNSWPAEIGFFPDEGKIYMSDGYVAKNFLGYGFLHAAFTARYNIDGGFTLFIIHDKAKGAAGMLDKYLSMMKEDKIRRQDEVYIVNDFFNGDIYMYLINDFIVGVMNTRNEKTALTYIKKTAEKIKNNR